MLCWPLQASPEKPLGRSSLEPNGHFLMVDQANLDGFDLMLQPLHGFVRQGCLPAKHLLRIWVVVASDRGNQLRVIPHLSTLSASYSLACL